MREDVGSGDGQLCGLGRVGTAVVPGCGDGGRNSRLEKGGKRRWEPSGRRAEREAWESAVVMGSSSCPTHSQMKVPWGMVCRARTPQPILAVR